MIYLGCGQLLGAIFLEVHKEIMIAYSRISLLVSDMALPFTSRKSVFSSTAPKQKANGREDSSNLLTSRSPSKA